MPAVRIVFDTGEPASYYKGPISTFYPAAYIMGELIDSSYMTSYTPASARSWDAELRQRARLGRRHLGGRQRGQRQLA